MVAANPLGLSHRLLIYSVAQFPPHLFHGQLNEGGSELTNCASCDGSVRLFSDVYESFALAGLFSSSDVFTIEAAKLVATAINLPNWQELVCPTPPASL